MIESCTTYNDETFKRVDRRDGKIEGARFHGCTFRRCTFVEATLRACRFVECTFHDCDLSLVKLPESSFEAVRFQQSKVIGVDWTRARWPAVHLRDSLSFSACALNHSTFIGLELPGLSVTECSAVDVDFREADLSGADFSETDLAESLFLSTDLSQADLSAARNYQINPSRNTLKEAKFALPEAMSLLYNMEIELIET